ncbi:glutathione S-transferase [Nisaea acidiphila]|uniref:Glutathione S-transferase n=1 Tax=Nisaea acidiphila TaxID=1862145 RepID=A0A9J7AMG8_9PROT|nr:glutathione S-transferase [Nisaea acidiphila]UUX48154.1 glutathione S-transferase [Nisaea acidiphila]
MKLIYSPASPFVRKVLVHLKELGLEDKVEFAKVATSVVDQSPELAAANPVTKIPTLVMDNGKPLYDSRIITQYLASLAPDCGYYPADGEARWDVLRLEATAEGLMDAAVNARYERGLRPAEKQWDDWVDGQMKKVEGALKALDGEAASFGDRVDAGIIAVACACGYLDFRYGDMGWRESYPSLAAWYANFSERPSMKETQPPS